MSRSIRSAAEAEREGLLDGSKRAITRYLTSPPDLEYFVSGADARVAMSLDLLRLGRQFAEERQDEFGARPSKLRTERMSAYAKGFQQGALKEIWNEIERQKREVE